ncbi:RagB/SusD family nutrient uptake outer membrane protein [Sphingobacterium sp. LRF_L2]|uniref:RagB/SusD family nutrient uptake outer membrane protein n=1 Tax=Sphingobacterium sp. LRF_L2 TaxID=3369421 RepID=UPI003F642E7C
MKNNFILYPLLFLVLGTVSSCKDFLQEDAPSTMTTDNFYKTEADAEAAVAAVYDGIYSRQLYLLSELPTDNAECGQGVANSYIFALDGFTFGPVNDRIETLFSAIYATVNDANVAVAKIPEISFDETKRNRLVAEARFSRGLLYYYLVRFFGAVPLVLEPTTSAENLNVAKSSVEEVYASIIADATFAEEHLDEVNASSDAGRATKASAKILLADAYLTLKDYENARIKAKEVIDLQSYGLEADYFDLFTPENKFNKEFLFAIQNKGFTGSSTGFSMSMYLPRSLIPLPGGGKVAGNSADVPTQEYYDSFAAGDLRRDRTFFTSYDAGAGAVTFKPHWYKYFDAAAIQNLGEADLNFAIFRYADALLIYAEALNELQDGPTAEAYDAINRIRRRAYGKSITTSDATVDLVNLTKADFQEAVLNERRWEFGYENKRWFDLVRTGNLLSVLRSKGNANVRDYHVLFPIPQRELSVNSNLTQNEGYN